jgi:peroxiredoxin
MKPSLPKPTRNDPMTTLPRLVHLGAAALCFVAALVILTSAGLPQRASYSGLQIAGTAVAPEVGAIAPSFTITLLNGEFVTLASLRGTPVILNFWATWCVPCEVEMPELEQLYEANKADGLRVIAINIGEERAPIAEWVARLQLSFDIALDQDTAISQSYQLRGQPMTFVIDQQGIIRNIFFGATTYAALEAAIALLLANNN